MPERRFPSPWFIEDIGDCFVVKASNNRPLVYIYYGEGVARRSLAKLLTRDAARRIAAGIAKLPGLVQCHQKEDIRCSCPILGATRDGTSKS